MAIRSAPVGGVSTWLVFIRESSWCFSFSSSPYPRSLASFLRFVRFVVMVWCLSCLSKQGFLCRSCLNLIALLILVYRFIFNLLLFFLFGLGGTNLWIVCSVLDRSCWSLSFMWFEVLCHSGFLWFSLHRLFFGSFVEVAFVSLWSRSLAGLS